MMNTFYILFSIITFVNFIIGAYLIYHHYEQKEINIDSELDIEDALTSITLIQRKLLENYEYIDTLKKELQLEFKNSDNDIKKDIIKRIPSSNDDILKEVQKMRDDFFALRQNF